jgi:hypothetical protein
MNYNHFMKKFSALLLTLLISFNSYSEWEKFTVDEDGDTWYIDTNTIKKSLLWVYWWDLVDLQKPDKDGFKSDKIYNMGDCAVNSVKAKSRWAHKQSMGRGKGQMASVYSEWFYPPPDSADSRMLNWVCNYVK